MPTIVWRKSSYSSGGGANCVEAGALSGELIAVRDSKARTGPALTFPAASFFAFTAAIREEHF